MADWTDRDNLGIEFDEKYHFEAQPYNGRIFNEAVTLDDIEEYLPNLNARTPDELKEFKEIIAIAKAAEPELKLLRDKLLKLHYNIFPTIADEEGIREWENWLDLIRLSTDTIEDRRFRIITKLNERIPYTWVQLHRMLASLCGWDGYKMTLENLELTVEIMTGSESQFHSVVDLLRNVLPMYILWGVNRLTRAGQDVFVGGVTREVASQHFILENDLMDFSTDFKVGGVMRNVIFNRYKMDDQPIEAETTEYVGVTFRNKGMEKFRRLCLNHLDDPDGSFEDIDDMFD